MSENEKLHPIPTAYEKASGIRPHPSTCHRHRMRGINGVRLETVKAGGRRMCSVEAVLRFFEATTRAADGADASPAPRTNRRRERDIGLAEDELAADGI